MRVAIANLRAFPCGLLLAMTVGAMLTVMGQNSALAQAGSVGGSLGKTEKSATSDRDDRPRRVARPVKVRATPDRSKAVKRPDPIVAPAPVGPRTFENPTVTGIRVDHCMTAQLGPACNQAAATYWCQSQGLSRAVSYQWEFASSTYRQKDKSTCKLPPCGAFSKLVCE